MHRKSEQDAKAAAQQAKKDKMEIEVQMKALKSGKGMDPKRKGADSKSSK